MSSCGGKDIDARNGIITNHELGRFNNLTVSNVKVADVYLRGIYASSDGTFNFNHDTVENVQGEEASIAMFTFGGSGVMSHNKVTDANDAISANRSAGRSSSTTRSANRAAACTPTTTAAPAARRRDRRQQDQRVQLQRLRDLRFRPLLSPTVKANKVKGCYIGLAEFGSRRVRPGRDVLRKQDRRYGRSTTDPAAPTART